MGNNSTSFIEDRIGNPFFSLNTSQDTETSKLLSQFKLLSTYQDNLFKRCSVISHKQTNQLIIVKEVSCQNEKDMDKMYQQFQRRKESLTDDNLVRLRYVLKKKADGIFADQFKIILFFDYVLASLKDQIASRTGKNQTFSADQVNMIIHGAVKGYAALEKQNIPNDKVRTRNIYFGLKEKDPYIKVIDSKLFPTPNNLICIKKQESDSEDVFLAPQQLREYNVSAFEHSNKTTQLTKSGVFSLGMILLQLCLLTPAKQLYEYGNKEIDYGQMETRLNIIKNKYPLSIFYMIREMLERNQESRPTFSKLNDSLPTNLKNLSQTQRLTLSVINASSQHINSQKSRTKILPPTGYTKLINPTALSTKDRKMQSTSLASQYRPNVDSSEVYTNGNMYTGQKKDGLRHGKGKYIYNDGSYYYGEWFKGKMQGQGQLYNVNGDLEYEGHWKEDHYSGAGILYGNGVDWSKYEGDFLNGKMEGFGEMIFRDGNRYKGEFRNDLPWGKGRMFLKGGAVQAGFWERGNFLQEL